MAGGIDREELDQLFNGLKNLGSKIIEYMAMDFWSESVEEAPIRKGTLRGSIQSRQDNDLTWIVGTDLEYAPFVHEGYDPFILDSPVNIDGNWVYIKEHPGYSGDPFFDRATVSIEDKIDTYLELALNELE